MLHLLPQHAKDRSPIYEEAVTRLASVRHALRLVDGGFGGGPGDDLDSEVSAAWAEAGEARQHWFDRRTAGLVGTAAAGIEALVSERQLGREPHAQASHTLVNEIRRELHEVAQIILR